MTWFENALGRRAPAGGATGLDGKFRRGGEFEPFYVPRQNMPQVDEGDLLPLLCHLAKSHVQVITELVAPNELLFHQHVFEDRIPAPDSPDMHKPLLVSLEGYVLDGNHRAAAHKRYGTRPVIFRLTTDFKDSLRAIFSFPKTYTYGEGTTNA